MALNKRKVLEAARKHAQKGAKAKALKEYNKLLTADPRDAKLLLEVGDAYRRWGQPEEAIANYGKVAQHYRQDGFDARAVAVFKQILNLDPKHYSAYVSLSELYQRMGLDSEAIAALQTAADGYHKEGRKTEALELLRQMAALDSSNTTSRLKVAELLRQEGMEDEALTEYEAVAVELETQGDREQLIAVQKRILELQPDRLESLVGLTRNLMAQGDLGQAEPLAVRALNASQEPAEYDLLIDLYAQMGDEAKLGEATRGLAKLYRDRGDEEKARELMQRLPVEDMPSGSRLAVDVSEVAEPELGDEELLDDEPFLADSSEVGDLDLGLGANDDIELDTPLPDATPEAAPAEPVAPEALPEGDPDQLLAEASVYLRYGKADQAIASLRGVLAQEPEHRGALEKLGEAYADAGQNAEAVDAWTRAAAQVSRAGDAEAMAVLRDRIAALDPAAAEQLPAVEAVEGGDASAGRASASELDVEMTHPDGVDLGMDIDVDLELDLDDAIDEVAASETQSGLDFSLRDEDDADAGDFEIELGDESIVFDKPLTTEAPDKPAAAGAAETTAPDTDLGDLDLDLDVDIELDLDDDASETLEDAGSVAEADEEDGVAFELELDDDDAADEAPSNGAEQSTRTTERINEELEEVEFYVTQGMFDEAEEIVNRILESAPKHPGALLRQGEIAAARSAGGDVIDDDEIEVLIEAAGDAESADVDPAEDDEVFELDLDADDASEDVTEQTTAPDAEVELDLDLDVDEELALDVDDEAVAVSPDEGAADAMVSPDPIEVETSADQSMSAPEKEGPVADEAPATQKVAQDTAAPEPAAPVETPEVIAAAADEAVATPVAMDAAASSDEASDGNNDTFDLREALADVFEDEGETESGDSASGVLSTVEDGFESIFSDFKKGVSATLEVGDYDTRYDLGIAYREMGLFDDAIGEFRVCLDSPERRFDSLYLMGLCARDLGRFEDAVNHLEQALALPDIPTERLAGVYMDLSIAEEGTGDAERAKATMQRVLEIESDFPGAAERLATLESGESAMPEVGMPGEGFESFDDLFEDDGDDEEGDAALVEAAPAEAFEGFDDVVTEAEAVLDDAEVLVEDDPTETAPIATPDPDEDTQSKSKSGRKKISFV